MQVGNISNIYNIKNGLILKRTPSFRSGNCSDSFERTTSNLVSQPNKQTAAEEETRLQVIAHYNYTLRFRSCGLSRED